MGFGECSIINDNQLVTKDDNEEFFIISESHPNLVLDIEGGSSEHGAKLIIHPYHGGKNQKFKLNKQGNLVAIHSGLALDIQGGLEQGANIIQWEAHGGANQKWKIHNDGTIRLEGYDLVLDVKGGSFDHGNNVIAWPLNGGSNQRFKISTQYANPITQPADYFYIVCESHPDLFLDIEGASSKQGAKLIVYPYHGRENQRFKFTQEGYIVAYHSSLVLDIEGGPNQGANIIQWDAHEGSNQKWKIHRDGTIRLQQHNLVLDVKGESFKEGNNVIAWPLHGGSNQRFRIANSC